MSTATLPAASALLTVEEFLRLHGGEGGVDLVNGRVVRQPPMPGPEHGSLCGEAYSILREFVKPRDLGRLMTNDTFIRVEGDTVRGADVCYISYQRLPKDQPLPAGYFKTTPPELVIEVRSPSDRMTAIMKKIDDYLTAGVDVVVLLDPAVASVTVFRKDFEQQLVKSEELRIPELHPDFSVPVDRFFA